MPAVRFAELELTYGCHAGRRLRFRDGPEPLVVHGPNGSGKSTLLEALVRVLFGFNRRLNEDRDRLEARRPWERERFIGRVVLRVGSARWEVERDFTGHEVAVRPLEGVGPADSGEGGVSGAGPARDAPWRGDGNPGSSNREAEEYRRRLRDLFGFSEREAYEATACVHQGELTVTRLNDDLLQLAAGGHGSVEVALERLREEHRKLTVRPIAAGKRSAIKDRALEEARALRDALEAELAQAEDAVRRRAPIQARVEGLRARREALRGEVEMLEAAQEPLGVRRALRAEAAALEGRRRAVSAVRRKVEDALRRYETAAASVATPEDGISYPDDFPERLSRLETLWRQRQDAEARRDDAERELARLRTPAWVPVAATGGAAAGAIATVLLAAGWPAGFSGGLAAGLGAVALALLALAGMGWDRTRSLREGRRTAAREAAHRLAGVHREIERALEGVPHGDSLRPSNAPDRRERFERQRRSAQALDEARRRLADALDEAQEALERAEAGLPEGGEPARAAVATVERLVAREDELRKEEARKELELERGTAAGLRLPEGVSADLGAVGAALTEGRRELERLSRELRAEERALLDQGAPSESPVALRDRLEEVKERIEELKRAARIRGRAYELIGDAYAAFRERDEERLVGHVSRRMNDLSGGVLGPVEVERTLSEATVRLRGRPAPLACPPLSYGEYHAALLGIRLGAIDFLSAAGIRPPLIVDDPFVHLDAERAAGFWEVLRQVAADRQVIVATQDGLLLRHLGVEADVRLEAPREAGAKGATGSSVSPPARPRDAGLPGTPR